MKKLIFIFVTIILCLTAKAQKAPYYYGYKGEKCIFLIIRNTLFCR